MNDFSAKLIHTFCQNIKCVKYIKFILLEISDTMKMKNKQIIHITRIGTKLNRKHTNYAEYEPKMWSINKSYVSKGM